MSTSVFIADQNTRCGKKISDIFITEGYRVIKTTVKSSQQEIDEHQELREAARLVDINWDCFSPYSGRNTALALRKYSDISHYIIILSSPEAGASLHRQTLLEFQKGLDFYIRSQILLSREMLALLSDSADARLSFVLNKSPALDHPYRVLFKSFINCILRENIDNTGICINAFEPGKESIEAYADFIYSSIKDRNSKTRGKWQRQSFLSSLGMPGSF